MTLRKWFYLFWTTLLVGALSAVIIGVILQVNDQQFSLLNGTAIGFNAATMLLGGAMISVLSQMGFFAYLIIRFIAIGIVRSKWVWDALQLIIVLITLFDLVYLRHADTGAAWGVYFILPVAMFIIAVAVALWKVKLTNPNGFIPTLFFMLSVTAIEAVPALRINSMASTLFMLVPLTVSNAWQILILPKVLKTTKEPL